jgi:hypothetical protein
VAVVGPTKGKNEHETGNKIGCGQKRRKGSEEEERGPSKVDISANVRV